MQLFLKGLEDYMLPCLNKKYLGFECMGCGLQRSAALLLRGEFVDAFLMYPAIYSIIALFMTIILNHFKNIKYSNKIIFILAMASIALIVGNFLIKLYFK
jgi:hypothetical protein